MFLVAISEGGYFDFKDDLPQGIVVIDSPGLAIGKHITSMKESR